jgi:hypothetical protein
VVAGRPKRIAAGKTRAVFSSTLDFTPEEQRMLKLALKNSLLELQHSKAVKRECGLS